MDNGRSNHIHARKDTRSSSLKHHLGAIAIVFDFMNPVLPLWGLINRESKLRLDESNAGGYAKHWLAHFIEEAPDGWMPGLLPLFQEERDDDCREPSQR